MLIPSFDNIPALPAVTDGLLPAIHSASPEPVGQSSLDATPQPTGIIRVWENTSGVPITLAAGLGRTPRVVAPGGHCASDGRLYYPVERRAGTNSYYPTDFNRELFSVYVSEEMLMEGQTVRLSFDLALRTFVADTMCQWVLQLQIGQRTSDVAPATTGENLQGFEWLTASLEHPITFGSIAQAHTIGLQVQRLADEGGLAKYRANSLLFNTMKSCQAPTASKFVIRARLRQFDTENGKSSPRGFVAYQLTGAKMEIA